MKISGNTILITGGSSGIGLGLATRLESLGNTVIITGRDASKLDEVMRDHPSLRAVVSDAGDPAAISALASEVTRQFPALNILINNAGIMRKIDLHTHGTDLIDLSREIDTNLSGPIRLTQAFLSHLKSRPEAAIVNVTSGIAYVPFPISPIYSAAKAGLHAFTAALRVQLKNTRVRVIELAPPSTDTALNKAFTSDDLKGVSMLPAAKVVDALVKGLGSNREEILPGLSKIMRIGSRIAPNALLRVASRPVDAMLAENAS